MESANQEKVPVRCRQQWHTIGYHSANQSKVQTRSQPTRANYWLRDTQSGQSTCWGSVNQGSKDRLEVNQSEQSRGLESEKQGGCTLGVSQGEMHAGNH